MIKIKHFNQFLSIFNKFYQIFNNLMYFQILKKSDQTIYNFFPAFDRSIECISHMTYDMDSKTFFCQQNLSKLLLHAKKSPKSAFRVYIYAKNEFFGDFFAGFTFPIATYPTRGENNVQKCFNNPFLGHH